VRPPPLTFPQVTSRVVYAGYLIADRARGLTYADLIWESRPLPARWDTATVRRHPRPNPMDADGTQVVVIDGLLSDAAARDIAVNRAFKERMELVADYWAKEHGYTIRRASWNSSPPVDPAVDVPMRLECWMEPRLDGEWPAIRQALLEDEEDRRAALSGSMDPEPGDRPFVRHITVDGRDKPLPAPSSSVTSSIVWGDGPVGGPTGSAGPAS
jgi:hypothetical protein